MVSGVEQQSILCARQVTFPCAISLMPQLNHFYETRNHTPPFLFPFTEISKSCGMSIIMSKMLSRKKMLPRESRRIV